jgi:predicted aldo/keto reductase-like oxidoreductase
MNEQKSPHADENKTNVLAGVPRRAFGNTGVHISKLCFGGGSLVGADSRALLDEALKHGVDCWEIVSFSGRAYADYFREHPGIREKIFMSAKVFSTSPTMMAEQLDKCLHENEISVIDFLAIHGIDDVAALTDEVRKWAEKAKGDGKIRFFGFCTHKNMDKCLNDAADLGWIDGVQTAYNYRLQRTKRMEDALQKCHENGIGIFAVKSMGLCVQRETELQKLPLNREQLNSLLTAHDMSFEQAKLRAIWQNPHLTSICSLMPKLKTVQSNVRAALDECPLDARVRKLLADYAASTANYFCNRCGACEMANVDRIPICSIMDMLMYTRRYGMLELVAAMFARVPADLRDKMSSSDYSIAEECCPQKMPIAQLMKEAFEELGSL